MKKYHPNVIKHTQTGSALIIALLVMVLVATTATMMMTQQQTQIARNQLIFNADRYYTYSKLVETWANITLINNLKTAQEQATNRSSIVTQTIIDNLPMAFDAKMVTSSITVSGNLTDAQGRFNLNNLANENVEPQFIRLLMAVDPELELSTAKNIAIATHEWIARPSTNYNKDKSAVTARAQQPTSAKSAINAYYMKRKPSSRAAQAQMASASELRLVKGITPELYTRLQAFIIALPTATPININTASAPVLASLGLDLSEAQQLVRAREQMPMSDTQEFLKNSQVQTANIGLADVTINSEYFLVFAQVGDNSEKSRFTALLYRPFAKDNTKVNPDNDKEENTLEVNTDADEKLITVNVLWESRGGI